MEQEILKKLSEITTEERALLCGRTDIDRALYMQGSGNTVNAKKLLAAGKLITLRSHTRFVHFPQHTHDYVEAVYMCAGETTHIINGTTITLHTGELLFMNQRAVHEVYRAEETDIAVNFIILPEFFRDVLAALGEEETPLRRFLVDCLCEKSSGAGYLHFRVSQIVPVQNLIENLLYILLEDTQNKRKMSCMTMSLLFLQLVSHTDTLMTADAQEATALQVLSYVEANYAHGSLTDLAQALHYDLFALSREIKRKTGKTYTQLIQEKRLAQAAFLLRNTDRNVDDIAHAVGYENMGYFHRIFKASFGISPRNYRLQIR